MEKYLRLFAALERIFGKGYVSRLMGKQSNVITLPDKQARKFLDTELNVMEASEGAVKKGVQDLNNLVSDTKRLSTLNDQELLTITNNAERLAVKVNPPAPPPAPTADVLSITTKVNKNKDPNVLIDEYNKNQTRLRLTDDEGGTAISYDEFRKLQSRNNEIEKTLESLNVKPALDEVKPEGIVIPFTKKTEDFATGGRVGMAKGGITALKTLIKFLAKTRGHGSTKGSKSLQAVNPKQFGYKFDMLDPEMKDAINKNRLEYLENLSDVIKADKKLLREMKDLPKEWQDFMYKQANEGGNKGRLDIYNKINIDDAIGDIEQMKKNLEFKNLPGKEIKRRMNAEGGVSQGLDYLMGIERRGYSEGTTGLNATPQQNAMISDMHKRGMDVDTISTVVGVSTQEVQDAINSQTPAQVNQLNPIGTLSKIGNFFSNPVVQGIGAVATGGLTSLGTFAKGQLFGHVAGNLIGNQFNQQMYEQNLSDRGLSGGYTGTAAQQDALASEMSQNYGGSNESTGGDNSNASESGGSDTEGSFAVGGRVGYAGGSFLKTIGKKIIKKSKKPKPETTSIDPIIDENVDLSKRGFLKGAAGVGAGIAAFGSGALKLAKKGAKEVKDLDVVFRKNYDGEYVDGTPTVFSEIIADIVPYTKKAKTFLEDMVKQKKVIKNNDGTYFVDVQDIHDMGGDIGVFKDIGNKFNYKTFKTDNYVDIEEIKDLRSYSSPLKNNPTYGPIDFEDDAAEYVADALQSKTAKEIIKERTDLIERKLKERGDFAGGGPIKKIAQKLIKKPKKYKFTGEESLNDLYELERQGKITREDMNVYSPRYLEYLDAQIINKEKLYTPKEWEKTPEVLKNKMRGRIDPDWEEANFGEEFNWDQARSIEMKQQKQLQDFDITGRKKNAKGGLNYLMGL
jgi:hypothetical protein